MTLHSSTFLDSLPVLIKYQYHISIMEIRFLLYVNHSENFHGRWNQFTILCGIIQNQVWQTLKRWGGGVYIDHSETEDGKTPEEG